MSSEAVADELEQPCESSLDLFGLRLYAVLLISAGVGSVLQMARGVFDGSFVLDFGFLGIFIGRGLLMRMEAWRAWAVFVAWCGILLTPLAAVLFAFLGNEPVLILGLEPAGSAIVCAVFFYGTAVFLYSLWMRKLLTSEVVRRTFSDQGEASDGWWLVFLVVTTLTTGTYLAVTTVHERIVERTIDQLEYHEAVVEVVDPEMGILSPVVSMDSFSPSRRKLPKISTGFHCDEFGVTRVHFSWLSTGPVEVTLSADGYVRKKVRLTSKSEGETIRVELAREKKASDSSEELDSKEQSADPTP